MDRSDGRDELFFQNSQKYLVHHDFAADHLSGKGRPVVPMLSVFNQTEYSSPDRRFILGALTHYEGPDVWAYEIAPYDTADASMIELAFDKVRAQAFMGKKLVFHPTSDSVTREAQKLKPSIKVLSTDELFAGIDYQPLNLATAIGQLRFRRASDLETNPVGFRDIVVLDQIPNDISVCSGTVTEAFQTPLSHINVLAQNRGTPNMGLRGAFTSKQLRALEGKWVSLTVSSYEWTVKEVTQAEADSWWEQHRPPKVSVPTLDLATQDVRDLEQVLDLEKLSLKDALKQAIPTYGGKASHFAGLPHIKAVKLRYPAAFVVPVFYYRQFMEQNGFDDEVEALLADPKFKTDPVYRHAQLDALQAKMLTAPVDAEFAAALTDRVQTKFGTTRVKFRSSTNCEDLEGFTGAGLYTSAGAQLGNDKKPILDAARTVWASVWRYRAFEEREYRGISHREVGMALLVNRAFPDEYANGVAISANPFDRTGVDPGFYVNVQQGDNSVVLPDPGVTSEQFIYHYEMSGQPIVYLGRSSLVPAGQPVLSRKQVGELGQALAAIQAFYAPVYGPNTPNHFYGMDVEFKFDFDGGKEAVLFVKQARPYPGRGQ
jgi:hypothetical protein